MTIYQLVNGCNPNAGVCLSILGLEASKIPRFRDAWLEDSGELIDVLTRTGGANREIYEGINIRMCEHAEFLRERDDGCDCTYCHFYYRVPVLFLPETRIIASFMADFGFGSNTNGPSMKVKYPKTPPKMNDPRVKAASEAWDRLMLLLQPCEGLPQ